MPDYALSDYLQFVLSGLSTGSIYVLIALGLITIYNVTGVVNLAQGEFVMLGAMFAVTLVGLHVPIGIAFAASVLGTVLVGVLIQRLTIHPARHAPESSLIIITIGTAIALRGLALLFWGTTPRSLPEFSPGLPLNVLGAILSRQRLWIMGTAGVVLLLLYLFFEFTLLGKAVRACSINRRASELLGINPELMSLLAYALGAGLGGIGGIVIAPLTLVDYNMGLALGLKGFVAAIMGGMVNAPAAVVGGLVLGVLESFTSGFLSSGIKDAVAFLALFIILLARTTSIKGLLQDKRAQRKAQPKRN